MSVSASPESAARRWTVCNNDVQRDYLSTLDIPMIAGRAFDPARAADNAIYHDKKIVEGTSVIIDRALAQQSGWTPNDAVGKALYLWMPGADYTTGRAVRVIGVVENKPLRLLGLGATSNMFLQRLDVATLPIIRIASTDVQAGLREIDAVWNKLAPNAAIKRRFANEVLNASMRSFMAVTQAFQFVATLALVIAVLGLIGMSLHIIGRRTHEIGVRKTMGASVRQILALLLKDFSKPVLIANLIAWPFAFVVMSVYLNIFVTRTALSIAPFIASLLLTLFIAWIAVLIQALRAARMNPATVLRHE
jgi:putative ABC transport system permease protein